MDVYKVQARVKDGFGGERVKRSYWKRKVIPDGIGGGG
jgi:hypothetical protein